MENNSLGKFFSQLTTEKIYAQKKKKDDKETNIENIYVVTLEVR